MTLEILQYLRESPVVVGTVVFCVGAGIYVRSRSNSSGPPLPPGPPPDLLIGNIRKFPKGHVSDGFSAWARTYGDIVHAKLPGSHIVILNSYEVAQELLAKRPNTTGGRNNGYMVTQIMGLGWSLPNVQPGATHTEVRKMLRRGIGQQRVVHQRHHDTVIEKRTAGLLLELQALEGDPLPLIMRGIGRLVTTVTYGEEIWKRMGEDLASWSVEATRLVNQAFLNFWPVDIINALRFIPAWVPGAQFKKIGQRATWLSDQIRSKPFAKVQELYQSGDLGHSIAADILEEFGATVNAQDALAVLYVTGADTTSTAVNAFCHALFLFPEVARKVHEEIEGVTGGARLPEIKDRVHLPYTEATWKEVFRWNPFFMLNMPHVNERDEIINGFLVPKGSVIIANNGFILMDPRVWGDPEVFRPERFLEPHAEGLPNPLTVLFGYGIRMCPGMYLADRMAFHYCATIAALYYVVPLEGQSIRDPSTVEYSDTALRLPKDFECRFIPRGERAQLLLRAVALEG